MVKQIKHILWIAILGAVFVTASAFATPAFYKVQPHEQAPRQTMVVSDTATTTRAVARVVTHAFEGEYNVQGACLKIKDENGGGYTYMTTHRGVATFSTISCE